MPLRPDVDIVVIGAGVAGLAAATALEAKGLHIAVLEARDRIGGRIHTIHDPQSPLPIELGAEFVHGRAPEILDLARKIPTPLVDVAWNPAGYFAGEWQQDRGFDTDAVLDEAMAYRGPDISWAAFTKISRATQDQKDNATRYIEGFEAAHADRISVHSIQLERIASESIEDDRQFRIPAGYDSIPRFLASRMQTPIRLSTPVQEIRWRKNYVEIDSGLSARAAVITLPIGVLQSHSVLFEPEPKNLRSAFDIEAGQVFRVVLRLPEPIWERNPELRDAGFLFSDSRPFPTWWTTLPMRTPLITAWSAGPRADEVRGTPEQIGECARGTLEHLLGVDLEAVPYLHDWRGDPFARCAYSYAKSGRLNARQELATPTEDTLFFAGEATETDGFAGTVHGAIRSGYRAAGQLLSTY